MSSNLSTASFLLGCLIALSPLKAFAIHTNQGSITTEGAASNATMSWALQAADTRDYTALFDTDDTISVSLTVEVDEASVGTERNLYLAARLQDAWYMRDRQGRWRRWSGMVGDLVPFSRKILSSTEVLDVHNSAPLLPGEYAVYGGYESDNGAIVYNQQPLTFIVFDESKPNLHRFRSGTMLENYLVEAMISTYTTEGILPSPVVFEPSPSIGNVSQTNVQEQGVDEADLIKTDGQYLYSLERCSVDTSSNCISTYRISESPSSNQLLNQTEVPGELPTKGIYLLKDRGEGLSDLLVTAGGVISNSYTDFGTIIGIAPLWWEEPRFWVEGRSEVNLFQLNSESTLTHERTLSFDGTMVSSRVIGDTLYLVTRYTPTVEGLDPYPFDNEAHEANRTLLESASLSQLSPGATTSGESRPLINAEACYLAPSATAADPDPSIISVIAVPLADPDNLHTTCFIGTSEVLYASQEAIYLVAESAGLALLSDVETSLQSEIHKLALTTDADTGPGVEYRGSARVVGHLGYDPDYKSYRMGEHEDVLRIATSIGHARSENSSTSVAMLRESADGGRLEEVGRLDNLGRPGEALYAARFLGDRGYLVTFKKVDPLYVLDLSDPENPVALGELEVSGYSNYLHPVGENYLLGIGKEAIDDENSTDLGGLGFAWYQGLKVSLFDVSDPTSPTEVNSLVFGGRGTTSTILTEPHAFASLPQADTLPMRFSIPVKLNNEPPSNTQPYAYWGWTHTGLYTFDIHLGDTPGVELVDQFVVEDNTSQSGSYSAGVMGDRSVILGDSVHYLHDQALYSSDLPAREL
jgi:hypothetical protein